jgi:hypothetical protein
MAMLTEFSRRQVVMVRLQATGLAGCLMASVGLEGE